MPITKNQKNNKYMVRVNFTDNSNRYVSKYGTASSYKEAKELERHLYEQRYIDCSITFGDLCDKYLRDCEIRCKPSTILHVKHNIKMLQSTINKNIRVFDVSPSFVRNWQVSFLKKGYSLTYSREINARFQSIMELAVKYYGLSENPVRIAGKIGEQYGDEKDYLTLEEFNQFLAGIDKQQDMPSWVFYNVLFYTGCRMGEAMALYPKDINFKEETISINKTFQIIEGTPYLTTPKTQGSIRCIKIPHFLCDILQSYVNMLPTKNIRIFFSLNGTHLIRVKKKACKITGIKYIKNHEFRHSNITFLISKDVPILEITKQVGHASPDITYSVYAHLYPNRDRIIADLEEKDFQNWISIVG